MKYTDNLELPIYDTPDIDIFNLEDWNIANQNLDKAYDEIIAFKNELPNANATAEVIEARKGKLKLSDKITEMDNFIESHSSQLEQIAISFEKFQRLAVELNDLGRLKRAYEGVPEGSTILFSNKSYEFGNGIIELNRNVNLKGNKLAFYDVINKKFIEGTGTIFKNLKIVMKSRGYDVENIANQSESIDNGFEANTGNCTDVTIRNCACKCYSHAYLFESYNGFVNNIKVYDSFAYDSTHGFITKSLNSQFINCYALNMTQYGFGFISDNIPLANKKGIATGGMTINCKAENCKRGIAMYSRDMHSEDNANGISLSKLTHVEFKAINCETGYMFGDGLITTDGITYNPIYDINCIGCTSTHSDNTQSSLEIKKVIRLNFNGYIDGVVNHNGFIVRDVNLNVISPFGNRNKLVDDITINNNNSFPSLELKNAYENTILFKNTQATIVQGLLGGNFNKGDILTLRIDDNFTYVKHSSNLILTKPMYKNKGTWVKLQYDGASWIEIGSYQNGLVMNQVNLATTGTIDETLVNNIDFIITTTTVNKIELPSPNIYNYYKLLIRNVSGGQASYGGFDTSNLVSNDLIKTTLENGKAQSIDFEFNSFVNKWMCVKVVDTKVF